MLLSFTQWKTIARTRATPRRNLRGTSSRAAAAAAARLQRLAGGVGVKNIEHTRLRNKDIKIKKLLKQIKNIKVKHRGIVVRKMTVRRGAIFPATRRQREY